MNAPETLPAEVDGRVDPQAEGDAGRRFDWQACWHPVAFCADLPEGRPLAFTLHDEPLVLFRDGQGRLCGLEDRCPHRMAQLSNGRVVDGRLECGYHGWQFGSDGACLHIPQLQPGQPVPARACVRARAVVERQGIAWVWSGEASAARPDEIPAIAALDVPGVTHVDYVTDLPYDQGYLVENVIDVAHIHIAHDGMRGGGHRHLALPLAFDVLEDTARGVRAHYRSIVPGRDPTRSPLAHAVVEFRAPGLVHYTSEYRNHDRIAGLALYSLPLGRGRCRLLYRKYSNFYSWRERWKPRWLEHWTQNTILRQDMDLIVRQYAATECSGRELRELWLPLKSSDTLVIRYRQWLDRNAPPPGVPYRGFATHASGEGAKEAPGSSGDSPLSSPPGEWAGPGTFALHTHQCATCTQSLRRARAARHAMLVAMALLLPAALLVPAGGARIAALVAYAAAGLAALGLRAFEKRFE